MVLCVPSHPLHTEPFGAARSVWSGDRRIAHDPVNSERRLLWVQPPWTCPQGPAGICIVSWPLRARARSARSQLSLHPVLSHTSSFNSVLCTLRTFGLPWDGLGSHRSGTPVCPARSPLVRTATSPGSSVRSDGGVFSPSFTDERPEEAVVSSGDRGDRLPGLPPGALSLGFLASWSCGTHRV